MSIDFACAECGQKYRVNPDLAGRATSCKKCHAALLIPGEAPIPVFEAEQPAPFVTTPYAKLATRMGPAPFEPYASPGPVLDEFEEIDDPRGSRYRKQKSSCEPAEFGPRFLAWLIDSFLFLAAVFVSVILLVIVVGLMIQGGEPDDHQKLLIGFGAIGYFLLVMLLSTLYPVLMVCSRKQGTLGKMAMGIRVTDLDGCRLGFGQSLGRQLAKLISGSIPFGIGYIMGGFTERKQALHDMMASTLVLKKH